MGKEVALLKEEVIQKLDSSVMEVLGSKAMKGFTKAHLVAKAIGDLRELLTPEYMAPIMALQGSKLGFRTDKDKVKAPNGDYVKGPGYPIEVVKDCLIEAVLMGLEPTGNQFNIIAGNTYPTKEGLGASLDKIPSLIYSIVCELPRVNDTKTSASVEVNIEWTFKGNPEQNFKKIPIPIKMDSYTTVDALIGKATRKGRAWLLSKVLGVEVTDGEVEDVTYKEVSSRPGRPAPKTTEQINDERILKLISDAKTSTELESYRKSLTDSAEVHAAFEEKMEELIKPKK